MAKVLAFTSLHTMIAKRMRENTETTIDEILICVNGGFETEREEASLKATINNLIVNGYVKKRKLDKGEYEPRPGTAPCVYSLTDRGDEALEEFFWTSDYAKGLVDIPYKEYKRSLKVEKRNEIEEKVVVSEVAEVESPTSITFEGGCTVKITGGTVTLTVEDKPIT